MPRNLFLILLATVLPALLLASPRARNLGIPFQGVTGLNNAITDVNGVTVGHATVQSGSAVRTGVTAVLPRGKTYDPVYAGWHTLNANGELTGLHWIRESGFLEGPVLLTNTHSVGAVHEGALQWKLEENYFEGGLAALPVIGETWDGFLNDINGFHVRPYHAVEALSSASYGPVEEGNVGGGTGMVCFRFKGGIGTASRVITIDGTDYTVGVLVQANFGRRSDLRIRGVPVGRQLSESYLPEEEKSVPPAPGGNSIICIIATDAPLLPHQLDRVAQRGAIGVARTGGTGKNSSGDFFLAFSTANPGAWKATSVYSAQALPNDSIDAVFDASIDATEEAILNALVAARTLTGREGNTVYEIPHNTLLRIFQRKSNSTE